MNFWDSTIVSCFDVMFCALPNIHVLCVGRLKVKGDGQTPSPSTASPATGSA